MVDVGLRHGGGGANLEALTALINAERACWGQALPSVAFLIKRTTSLREREVVGRWRALCEAYDELAEVEREQYPVSVVRNDLEVGEALRQIICTTETG